MISLVTKPLQTDYLKRLTDDTGIFQHTKFGIPDRTKGYTTDDNARALIAAVMLYKSEKSPRALDLMSTYLAFVYHSQNDNGTFRNFMDYDRQFIENKGSEDCLGRCLWALGFTLSEPSVPENFHNTCRYMFDKALTHVRSLKSPRAQAYAVVGLSYRLEAFDSSANSHNEKKDAESNFLVREIIEDLVEQLSRQYRHYKNDNWHWFEDSLTYSNAVLPWAFFKASHVTGRASLQEIAKESLDFLASLTFSSDGYYKPIGCHGWLPRNGEAAKYDEQPIEACEMLMACREAYGQLEDEAYWGQAVLCYEWYLGRNSKNLSLLDAQTGACYDGITAEGLNLNQGSESIISYSIAHLVMSHE